MKQHVVGVVGVVLQPVPSCLPWISACWPPSMLQGWLRAELVQMRWGDSSSSSSKQED